MGKYGKMPCNLHQIWGDGSRVVYSAKKNYRDKKNSKYGTIYVFFKGGNTGKCHVICIKYREMGAIVLDLVLEKKSP